MQTWLQNYLNFIYDFANLEHHMMTYRAAQLMIYILKYVLAPFPLPPPSSTPNHIIYIT